MPPPRWSDSLRHRSARTRPCAQIRPNDHVRDGEVSDSIIVIICHSITLRRGRVHLQTITVLYYNSRGIDCTHRDWRLGRRLCGSINNNRPATWQWWLWRIAVEPSGFGSTSRRHNILVSACMRVPAHGLYLCRSTSLPLTYVSGVSPSGYLWLIYT